MGRRKTFTFRVTSKELRMIALLAKNYHRSQSDMVRLLILKAYKAAANGVGIPVPHDRIPTVKELANEEPSSCTSHTNGDKN
jgi:hypothetical protein